MLSVPIHVVHAGAPATSPYIVTLRDGISTGDFVNRQIRLGVDVIRQFTLSASGFLADLTPDEYLALKNDQRVERIEEDVVIGLSIEQSLENDSGWRPSWGLDRINQVGGVLDDIYSYEYTGSGVDVYILDTGVNSSHIEFTGRIKSGYSAIDDTNGTEDCNGHGSHVSGIVGGTTYGVAKSVSIIPVRILNCSATGTISSLLSGINWMIANHQAGMPAVANLSVSSGKSKIINDAVVSAIDDGITVVIAAGNNNADACNYSPASEPLAITVGASTSSNVKASYSNYGSCVDIFAPGSDIVSAFYGSSTILRSRSGTSQASPHVSGVIAQILEQHTAWTPEQISEQVISQSTPNALSSTDSNTVNLLLFNNSPRVIATETPTTTTVVLTTTTTTTTIPETTTTTSTTTTTLAPVTATTTTSTTSTTVYIPSVTTTTISQATTTTITVAPTTTTTTVSPITTTIQTTTPSSSTTTPSNQQEEQKQETAVMVTQPPQQTSKPIQAPSQTSSTSSTSTTTIQAPTTTVSTAPIVRLSAPPFCKTVGKKEKFYGIKYTCIRANKTLKWVSIKK
jgi:subtilisin family serine protease